MNARAVRSLLLVALLVLAGCSALPAGLVETEGPSPTAAPGAPSPPTADYEVTVSAVVDGDTLRVEYDNGTTATVRLIGVDTPEVHVPVDPPEFGVANTTGGRACLRNAGENASTYTREALLGRDVGIAFDPNLDRRGYYGRLLVYVVVDEGTHNYRLVADGRARVYESGFTERAAYAAAADAARSNATGVWRCAAQHPADGSGDGTGGGDGADATTETPTDAGLSVVGVTADPEGRDGDHLNGEVVVFENTGDDTLALEGWTVSDAANHRYTFGTVTLEPGDRITLHTASGTDTATDVYWGESDPVWNNDGDTVHVRTTDGTLVVSHTYS